MNAGTLRQKDWQPPVAQAFFAGECSLPKQTAATPLEVVNIALTETLRRTIHTSMTLLLVVVTMLMGGDGLKWFSIAMFVGVFVGTYSSIYSNKYF